MSRAAIFDLEGVVIDTEILWDEISEELLKRHGAVYDRGVAKHLMMGKTLKEGVIIMKEKLGLTGDADKLTHEQRQIAKEIFAREVAFVPGAKAFVENISAYFAIAVATSMERGFLGGVDRALGLSALFGGHVYSIEDIGFVSKPNPDIFLYAAEKLGIPPASRVVFEDAPNGVLAAKRAGMMCIALTTSTTRERLSLADQIADSYAELSTAGVRRLLEAAH